MQPNGYAILVTVKGVDCCNNKTVSKVVAYIPVFQKGVQQLKTGFGRLEESWSDFTASEYCQIPNTASMYWLLP